MYRLLLLSMLVGCSNFPLQQSPEVLHPSLEGMKASQKRYWKVKGGEHVLRNTSAATLAVWIKPAKKADYPMDLIAVSVGGKKAAGNASRASMRINPGHTLVGVARALDTEKPQYMYGPKVIKEGKWQHVALIIDYAASTMEFFHDGKSVGKKTVKFKGRRTSDTPSHSIIIGSEDDGTTKHFEGEFKHAGIWNRRLSQEEIKELVEQFTTRMR